MLFDNFFYLWLHSRINSIDYLELGKSCITTWSDGDRSWWIHVITHTSADAKDDHSTWSILGFSRIEYAELTHHRQINCQPEGCSGGYSDTGQEGLHRYCLFVCNQKYHISAVWFVDLVHARTFCDCKLRTTSLQYNIYLREEDTYITKVETPSYPILSYPSYHGNKHSCLWISYRCYMTGKFRLV